jgi:tetratricopeptide (TPR) repeat protein
MEETVLIDNVKLRLKDSMFNLGIYYKNIGNNEKMLKYLEMGICYNCDKCMYELGCYYDSLGNRKKALEYILLSSEYNNINALLILGCFSYENNDIKSMKKYIKKAIKEDKIANILYSYYEWKQGNISNCINYFYQGIDFNIKDGNETCYICYNEVNKYITLICNHIMCKKCLIDIIFEYNIKKSCPFCRKNITI